MSRPNPPFGRSRDLGIRGGSGAGKGDADRSNRKAFVAGLAEVAMPPHHYNDFAKVGLARWRKVYTAASLASKRAHGFSSVCSSDH